VAKGAVAVLLLGSLALARWLFPSLLAERLRPLVPWELGFIGLLALGSLALIVRCRRAAADFAHPRGILFDLAAWLGLLAVCWSALTVEGIGSRPTVLPGLLPYLQLTLIVVVVRVAELPWSDLRPLAVAAALSLAVTVLLDAEGLLPPGPYHRPCGLVLGRNFAGQYLVLALPGALVLLTRSRSRWLLPLLGVGLALSRCRLAWLAAAVAGGLLLVQSAPADRRRILGGTLLVAAGGWAATLLPTGLSWSEPRPFLSTLSRLLDLESGSGANRV
jgi:hypothetical protein